MMTLIAASTSDIVLTEEIVSAYVYSYRLSLFFFLYLRDWQTFYKGQIVCIIGFADPMLQLFISALAAWERP